MATLVFMVSGLLLTLAGGTVRHLSFQLREEKDRSRARMTELEGIYQASPVGLAMVDPNFRYIHCNSAIAAISGLSQRDHVGRLVSEIWPLSAAQVQAALRNALEFGQPVSDIELTVEGPDLVDGPQTWIVNISPVAGPDGAVVLLLLSVLDISERKRAERQKTLMINELNHRVKNTLTLIQAIASRTFKNAAPTALLSFEARLFALSNAHDVLTREGWSGADLREIVENSIAPYRGVADSAFIVEGASVRLSPPSALSMAMTLHELCTNALKHGALSVPSGIVRIVWMVSESADSRRLFFHWTERGGPAVSQPARAGFGTRLIARSLAAELGAKVDLRFAPEGVVCDMSVSLPPPESQLGQIDVRFAS